MVNNITRVRLLSVPLESDYKHTLYFASPEAQYTYFLGKTVFNEDDFSYQRKEGYIRYPKHIDDLSSVNYIMYQNADTSTKWYYAFITDLEFKGDESTFIHFELDVIQTYMFDYNIRPSFVEREHVDDDRIGINTYPENIECGEFVSDYESDVTELTNTKIVVGVTEFDPVGTNAVSPGQRVNGLYSGIGYFVFNNDDSGVSELNALIKAYDEEGKGDAIQCMFLAPEFISKASQTLISNYPLVLASETPKELSYKINKSILSNGSSIKNNKLYCFPYKYLLVSNNNGASAIYHFEHFRDDEMEFSIKGCLTPGCSIRLIPKNYKGVDENKEEGLNLGKYPILNWNSDIYTNWLTQNGTNIALNIAVGGAQIVAGAAIAIATGGAGIAVGGGQAASGATMIGSQLSQIHQMSFTPPQARGNINCGDVVTASNHNTFSFYEMSIRPEYITIVDNYFSMFGYKCNRVKVPFSNHRENYWYTKTIDVSIEPVTSKGIPMNDQQKIKECYNSGITFWRDPSKICDYSVSNKEI